MTECKTWVRKTDTGEYVIVRHDSAGATVMALSQRFKTRGEAETTRYRMFGNA